ncbi:MAG: RNase J family beta-CASP ribonuclease, partial [Actinomycetia bacterium]|nr:RNase J family beta-CASP ribonuclease [Actinomycetes bacterium]
DRVVADHPDRAVLAAVDLGTGRVVHGPEITARGFSDDPDALLPIRRELAGVLERAIADGARDADALEHLMRRALGRWVDQTYRRRPMLIPKVVEV